VKYSRHTEKEWTSKNTDGMKEKTKKENVKKIDIEGKKDYVHRKCRDKNIGFNYECFLVKYR